MREHPAIRRSAANRSIDFTGIARPIGRFASLACLFVGLLAAQAAAAQNSTASQSACSTEQAKAAYDKAVADALSAGRALMQAPASQRGVRQNEEPSLQDKYEYAVVDAEWAWRHYQICLGNSFSPYGELETAKKPGPANLVPTWSIAYGRPVFHANGVDIEFLDPGIYEVYADKSLIFSFIEHSDPLWGTMTEGWLHNANGSSTRTQTWKAADPGVEPPIACVACVLPSFYQKTTFYAVTGGRSSAITVVVSRPDSTGKVEYRVSQENWSNQDGPSQAVTRSGLIDISEPLQPQIDEIVNDWRAKLESAQAADQNRTNTPAPEPPANAPVPEPPKDHLDLDGANPNIPSPPDDLPFATPDAAPGDQPPVSPTPNAPEEGFNWTPNPDGTFTLTGPDGRAYRINLPNGGMLGVRLTANGKPEFYPTKASAILMQACATGVHLREAVITARKNTGNSCGDGSDRTQSSRDTRREPPPDHLQHDDVNSPDKKFYQILRDLFPGLDGVAPVPSDSHSSRTAPPTGDAQSAASHMSASNDMSATHLTLTVNMSSAINTATNAVVEFLNQNKVVAASGKPMMSSNGPAERSGVSPERRSWRLVSTDRPRGPVFSLAAFDVPRPLAAWAARTVWQFVKASGAAVTPAGEITYSLVDRGKSSGQSMELQVYDPSGRLTDVDIPEGTVLEPVKRGAARPVGETAGRHILREALETYCVDYAKLAPASGTMYRIAPQVVQDKFKSILSVLKASRELADVGRLSPDSNGAAYAESIKQWALWAKIQNWTEQQFAHAFLEKTQDNVAAMHVRWTKQLEAGAKALIPGRWRDVSMVLDRAQKIAAGVDP